MTNFPDGMTRYDWEHVEGRHMNDNEPRGYRPSRTTGTSVEGFSEHVREIAAARRANQVAHRTIVIAITEHLFGAWCRSCHYDHSSWAIANDKAAVERVARAHEEANR